MAGLPVDVLLDTGAEVSVLTDTVWTTLPPAIRANANCHEMENDKKLSGLGGSLKALAIVDLPLESGWNHAITTILGCAKFPVQPFGCPMDEGHRSNNRLLTTDRKAAQLEMRKSASTSTKELIHRQEYS